MLAQRSAAGLNNSPFGPLHSLAALFNPSLERSSFNDVHLAVAHNLEDRCHRRVRQSGLRLCLSMSDVQMRGVIRARRDYVKTVPVSGRIRDDDHTPEIGHTDNSLAKKANKRGKPGFELD